MSSRNSTLSTPYTGMAGKSETLASAKVEVTKDIGQLILAKFFATVHWVLLLDSGRTFMRSSVPKGGISRRTV